MLSGNEWWGTTVISLGHSIVHLPLSFSPICWTSLLKILGFTLYSMIILCHCLNWFFFLLPLQCNTVSLLTLFLVSHHPFFLHLPCLCQMFCNMLMLTNTLPVSPHSIAIPSELYQFSSPCSGSHVSSVSVFISATFICVPSSFHYPLCYHKLMIKWEVYLLLYSFFFQHQCD